MSGQLKETSAPPSPPASKRNSLIMKTLRRKLSSFTSSSTKQPVTCSGWLSKMKRSASIVSVSDWNKRHFTIEGGDLIWYHAKDALEKAGSVAISSIKKIATIKPRRGASEPGATSFVVKASSRSLFLKAETSKDCSRWVRCIQMQMDLRSGGTAAGPRGKKNHRESNGGGDKFEHMIRNLEKTMDELEASSPVLPPPSSPSTAFAASPASSEANEAVWGGRLEFDHDKSILEMVSNSSQTSSNPPPQKTAVNNNSSRSKSGAAKAPSKPLTAASSSFSSSSSSFSSSSSRPAPPPPTPSNHWNQQQSFQSEHPSPSNSDFSSSGDFSPQPIMKPVVSKADRQRHLNNNLFVESESSNPTTPLRGTSSSRGDRFDDRRDRAESSPSAATSPRVAYSPVVSVKMEKKLKGGRASWGENSSPESSEKKTKKKNSSSSSGGSRKKLESSLGSSADFEKSYESSVEVNSPRENVAKAQHLDAVAAAEHTMVKPASAKLAYQQLEEFAELDELEGIVDHGGGWGAEVGGEERAERGGGEGERRKKGANRVSLVRSSRAGDGFVAPDPHRIVRTGW